MNNSFWIQFALSKALIIAGPILNQLGITIDGSKFIPFATGSVMTLGGLVWSIVVHNKTTNLVPANTANPTDKPIAKANAIPV